MNAVIDELGLVVEIHNGHAFGEGPIDLSNLFLNPFDYLFGIFVDSLENDNLILSARNIRRAKVVNSFGLNIYDLLYHDHLVLSRSAAEELEKLLGARKENGEAAGETPAVEEAPKPKRARKPKQEAS